MGALGKTTGSACSLPDICFWHYADIPCANFNVSVPEGKTDMSWT